MIFKIILLISVLAFSACAERRPGSRPVTVTLLILGDRPTGNRVDAVLEEINKITSERIGAVLRLRHIEWANWQNQYQLALASRDSSFDLVTTSTTWLFAWEIARRGGFYPLTPELLEKNAPKTWAAVSPAHWDICTWEDSIWFIPESQFTQYINHGMYWRKDWAKEGGLEEITVFEDLETYFDIVKEHIPDVFPWDISGNHLPLGMIGAYMQSKRMVQPILGVATGNYTLFEYDVNDPYTVVSLAMDSNEMFEAARMFDRWAKKGFWREDVLNYQGEPYYLFISGLSGAYQHHTNSFFGVRVTMDLEQPGSDIQMYYFGQENNNVNKNLITHAAMAVNGASGNVEKALQMYDLLRNDRELYLLFNYGIEGIDYIVNADGAFRRPDDFNDMTDLLGINFWGGRMDEFEPVWDNWWPGRQDMIDNLNSFTMEYPLEKFIFDSSRVSAEMSALGNVAMIHLPSLYFGKTADPDTAVEEFRAALRQAGFDRVKEEIQLQLDLFKTQLK